MLRSGRTRDMERRCFTECPNRDVVRKDRGRGGRESVYGGRFYPCFGSFSLLFAVILIPLHPKSVRRYPAYIYIRSKFTQPSSLAESPLSPPRPFTARSSATRLTCPLARRSSSLAKVRRKKGSGDALAFICSNLPRIREIRSQSRATSGCSGNSMIFTNRMMRLDRLQHAWSLCR